MKQGQEKGITERISNNKLTNKVSPLPSN